MPLGRSSKSGHVDRHGAEPGSESSHTEGRSTFNLGFGRPPHSGGRQERSDSSSSAKGHAKESSGGGGNGQGRVQNKHKQAVILDLVRPDELRSAHSIEAASLPREEASTIAQLVYVRSCSHSKRQELAPQLFIGAFVNLPPPMVAGPLSVSSEGRRRLVGFCSATVAPAHVTQSMYGSTHSDQAHVVCLHDFCVERGSRHQGIGRRLMARFLRRAQNGAHGEASRGTQMELVSIISPPKRMSFFLSCGFKIHGPSYIPKSVEPWVEMRYFFDAHHEVRRADTSFSTSDLLAGEHDYSAPPSEGHEHALFATEQQAQRSAAGSLSYSQNSSEMSPTAPWGMGNFSLSPTESSPGMTNDQVLAALIANNSLSEGAARDLGLPVAKEGQQNAPAHSKDTGKALSTIWGQAVAAKTASEDSLTALEARIVDRTHSSNIHKLLCPNENCGCGLVGRQSAKWAVKEMGPLSDKDAVRLDEASPPILLDLTNAQEGLGTDPLSGAPWDHILQRRIGTVGNTIGAVRGFWQLDGPMQFDNVSFSKNTAWKVPEATVHLRSPSRSSPGSIDLSSSHGSKRSDKSPRGSFGSLRGAIQPLAQVEQSQTPPSTNNTESPVSLGLTPGEERVVKYVLCPDCGCGPLGFMILPSDSNVEHQARKGYSDTHCYVAAYRVRYDC